MTLILLAGLHGGSVAHADSAFHERFIFVQFIQIVAVGGQNKGLLPHLVHPYWQDVSWSFHNNHNNVYASAERGH